MQARLSKSIDPSGTSSMNTLEIATHGPVIPVIVLHRVDDAVPLARALLAGGVKVLEVTLRTPVALRCIEAIATAVPEALVGARSPTRATRSQPGRASPSAPATRARSARPAPTCACRCCRAWPPRAR
jgi:hypothetical protein